MDTFFPPELPQFFRLIIAFGIVLGLMGGLAFLLKKLGLAERNPGLRNGKHRLRIVESLHLDARRRLMLLECDDKQHLVILGINGETLIDSDISAPPVDESIKADEAS